MKHKTERFDPIDHETLVAAVQAARETQKPLSSIEKARRVNEQRQILEANKHRRRLDKYLLRAASIDEDEVVRSREQDANAMRAFLEREKPAIVDQSSVVAHQQAQLARQRNVGLSSYGPGAFAYPQSLIALDVASAIMTEPTGPIIQPGYELDVKGAPPASMHNFVKSYAFAEGLLASEGPQFRADFLFGWTTDKDVGLNVATFVQLNGMYGVYDAWTPFDSTYSCVSLASYLRYFVPPPPFEGYPTRTSSQTGDNIDHCVNVGPFDFAGEADFGSFSDELTLFDNSFFRLPAGYSIIFVVSVIGKLYTGFHGIGNFPPNCSLMLDFRSADFGINVPAVYLGAFPMS